MGYERDNELIKTYTEITNSLSTSVKIDAGQIMTIVVAELLGKYQASVDRNDGKYIDAFGVALKFYLTEEEFAEYTTMAGE